MAHSGWTEAQLMIAFHTDGQGRARDSARAWPPKNALGRIHTDPAVQETFVELRSEDAEESPVQIKLRRQELVVTRDSGHGWTGVVVQPSNVTVGLGDARIAVEEDGTVIIQTAASETTILPDGSVHKITEDTEATICGGGMTLVRRTPDGVAAISEIGVLSKVIDQTGN